LHDISVDECRLIEVLLRHSNPNVRETALNVLADAGLAAEPLKNVLVQIAQGPNDKLSQKAIRTLAAIGTGAGPEVAPVLIATLRRGAISLQQFADAAGRLGVRSQESQAILERGLRDKDRWTARSCANALCITSNEPSRIARLVIDAARDGVFESRDAIAALNGLKHADDVVLPFLAAQLRSEDLWTRHDAANAIASFGEKGLGTITSLEKLLDHDSPLVRLKAAKAIFLVASNPVDLEKQLETAFAKDEPYDCHNALETITELNRSGARFVRHVLAQLRQSPPKDPETAIQALRAIGTAEAVAALRATAESSDWILRSQATEALRQLRHPDGKGGK
jgi:HEAT repeat protein